MLLYRNLCRTETSMMLGVVDDTELSWRHTVDLVFRMDDEAPLPRRLKRRWQIAWGMPDLEGHLTG